MDIASPSFQFHPLGFLMRRCLASVCRSLRSCHFIEIDLVLFGCWLEFAPRWITLLLNSFSLVPLLVGVCAEMDDTSFPFIEFCSAAGRDLRRDG